ncbi:MAG: hypothetical protein MJ120_06215 [Clostridia bacterium]|nr:hypothetical protein [Clostridia bacterium]
MEKFISFFTTLSLIFSYLLGFSAPSVDGNVKIAGKDSLVGISALYAGQGLTADEDYYYTSGSVFNQKSGIGVQFLAKWDADTFKTVKMNLAPIPRKNKKDFGSGHIGGISYYDGIIYAPVEGTDYSINFVYLYDADDLSLIKYYDVSCDKLDDGIPWIAVDGKSGFAYCSRWGSTSTLLRFRLDDMSLDGTVQLSEEISRIQGGEFYNGKLYLSKDESHSTEEKVLCVDVETGDVQTAFIPQMTGYDNEAEDITVYPRDDGSLFHVLNYDKLLGLNIMHYSTEK